MENQALDIIDMLYAMIAEAWGVPLGNDKCIVERDKALGLLDDLKAVLPQELSEARRLVNARNEFIGHAKQEAENIRRSANDDAEKKSREIRRAASSYLDDALHQTETAVAAALESVRSVRSQIKAVSAVEPEGKAGVTLRDVEDVDLLGQ